MNKIITFLIAFSLLAGVSSVVMAEVASTSTSTVNNGFVFTSTLRSGMSGSVEIVKLQQYLIDRGYLVGYADGKFGRMTHSAVIRFQLANGLVGDGIVGRGTRALLNAGIIPVQNSPTVLSPNGGENWVRNSTRQISWNISNIYDQVLSSTYLTKPNVDIYLNQETGCEYGGPCTPYIPIPYVLDKNISSNTIYNWIVGTDIDNKFITPGNYKVKICLAGTNICDLSNGFFTLSESEIIQPSVTVISPNSGEYMRMNSTHTISWRLNNTNPATKVDIYLDRQNYYNCGIMSPCPMVAMIAPYVLDLNVSNVIPYNWVVGTDTNNQTISPGSYQVRICITGTSICDSSDSSFTLASTYTM